MANDKKALGKTHIPAKSETPQRASVSKVREDLKNVIDTMGPHSPYLQLNSGDDDTTCSVCISSEFSSVSQINDKQDTSIDEKHLGSYLRDSDTTVSEASERTVHEMKQNNVSVQATPYPYYIPYRQYERKNEEYPWNQMPKKPSRLSRIVNYLERRFSQQNAPKNQDLKDLYKIDIQQDPRDGSPPRRLIFDLVDGIPKTDTKTVATSTQKRDKNKLVYPAWISEKINNYSQVRNGGNTNEPVEESAAPNPAQNSWKFKQEPPEIDDRRKEYEDKIESYRDEIYYFDHGNAEYLRTTDSPAVRKVENAIEKTEKYTAFFWSECFGVLHIGVAFVLSFFIQLIRFILHALLRPLFIGVVQMISDYFFKPCLTTAFNGVLQPILIFCFNIATSVRDLFKPIADCCGYFIREVAVLFKAMRLVQVEKNYVQQLSKPDTVATQGPQQSPQRSQE